MLLPRVQNIQAAFIGSKTDLPVCLVGCDDEHPPTKARSEELPALYADRDNLARSISRWSGWSVIRSDSALRFLAMRLRAVDDLWIARPDRPVSQQPLQNVPLAAIVRPSAAHQPCQLDQQVGARVVGVVWADTCHAMHPGEHSAVPLLGKQVLRVLSDVTRPAAATCVVYLGRRTDPAVCSRNELACLDVDSNHSGPITAGQSERGRALHCGARRLHPRRWARRCACGCVFFMTRVDTAIGSSVVRQHSRRHARRKYHVAPGPAARSRPVTGQNVFLQDRRGLHLHGPRFKTSPAMQWCRVAVRRSGSARASQRWHCIRIQPLPVSAFRASISEIQLR